MKTIIFATIFIFCSQLSLAQNRKLSCTVKSDEGITIEKVAVTFGTLEILTDEFGKFILDSLAIGTYPVLFEKEGYISKTANIVITDSIQNCTIILASNTKNLDEVIISITRSINEKPIEIGKIPILPFDLPQLTSIIDREILDQQQTQQMSDVLKNTNGVYIMGASGGYQEEIAGRGFAFGSNNTFKNGVRFNNGIFPEMSSLEKVEVLKGGSAILFGNVAAGGILNLVTKKPKFQNGGDLSMRVSSFEMFKPSIDIYGSLNKKNTMAYRLNTTYQTSNSFRDNVQSERFYINPSLLFLVGKKTEVLIEGDYLKDDRTADFGVGAINYELINIPRNTFIGFSWSYIKTQQNSLTATITHQLSKKWQLKAVNSYQSFQSDLFANVRPNSSSKFIKEDGTWVRGVQRTQIDEDYYLSQLDLTGKFTTGKIKHALLFGAEIDQYYTNTIAFNGISAYDTVNVYSIDNQSQRNDIPSLTEKTKTSTPRLRTGVYIQDLISFTEKIKLLAGVRLSYLESSSNVFTYATNATVNSKTYDHAYSPRIGIVYQPLKTMSLFSSYSNSFSPNTGVDITGNPLDPSLIDQYELGIKNDFFKGFLSLNATIYQIKNSNVAQMVLDNGNTNSAIKELAGEITSQGFELDVSTKQRKGFSFLAGYSFNETKYTASSIYLVGTKLLYQPRNTANASIYYEVKNSAFLKGLNFGVSTLYFGKRSAGRLTRLTVPNDTYKPIPLADYTTVDASVGYSKNKFSIRFKVSNIFNALSYNVHDDNSVNPIAPRMFTTTMSLKL